MFSPGSMLGLGPELGDKGGSCEPCVSDEAAHGNPRIAEPFIPQLGVCQGDPRLPEVGDAGSKSDIGSGMGGRVFKAGVQMTKDAGTPATNPFKPTKRAVSKPVQVFPPCWSVRGSFGQSLGQERGLVQVNLGYTSKI